MRYLICAASLLVSPAALAHDFWSNGEPVVTPYPDCVLVMPSLRQLRPGVTVVRLGRLVDDTGTRA